MIRRKSRLSVDPVIQEGAMILLDATLNFLLEHNISESWVRRYSTRRHSVRQQSRGRKNFRDSMSAYEDMGAIMSTWFLDPKYLDIHGKPKPLPTGRGANTIGALVRAARVNTKTSAAIALMKQSPSMQIDELGKIAPLKRLFVMPGFEIPRAAMVVERYLETLRRNSSGLAKLPVTLLERNCYVSEINLREFAPLLRDIKERGTAFMDSVDAAIEAKRLKSLQDGPAGELGVLAFAWTRPKHVRQKRSASASR